MRSLLGNTTEDVHQIDLPSDQPTGSLSTVLVYASSSLAEQTTPLALAFNDTDSSVSSINFTDRDLDADEIGGTISWTEPADPALVANYVVYIAEDQFGGNRSQVGSEVPWNSFDISLLPEQPIREPDGAARSEYSQVLVYTKSTLAEQSTPISFAIVDVNASVSGGAFQEQDLDEAELGGPITWKAPADLTQVTHYDVYFVEFPDATGTNRSQLGDSVEVGTNIIHVPADFLQGALSHIQVYTRSSLVEQSTPHVFVINNTNASVSSIEFLDDDLDDKELGGNVTWLPPDDMAQVSRFVSYLASDAFGGSRSQIANQPFDTEEAFVQPEQPLQNYSHVLVYTRSILAEQSTPASLPISDTFATVRNADFLDQDLDYDDLGGTIQWNPPADNIRTTDYVLYLSVGADGTGRQKVGQELVGTNKLLLLPDTTRGQLGFVTVFTRSVLLEQTTPAAVAVSDTIASVSGVDFLDLDLDEGEVGGTLTWDRPPDRQQVVYYKLYFSVADPFAAGQHVNGTQDWLKIPNGSVDVSLAEVDLAPDFALSGESHVLIYTQSALAEQTTPVGNPLNDSIAVVRNVSFTDLDLDDDELGGNVTWLDPPPEQRPDLVDFVDVYLSEDTQGAGRSQIQAGQASADTIELAAETALRSFRHILVFTRSSLAEQSTPMAFPISDTDRYVASLSFTDQDLDREEFGGNLSWQQPVDASLVAHYVAYLATTPVGSDRAHVAELEAGSTVVAISEDTAVENYTHLLLYTKSILVEQTTPVAVNISDTVASVSSVEFVDQDLDIDDLGGDVAWAEPVSDIEYVHFYDVYLANSSAGAFRSQLGHPIPQGLAQTRVPVDLTKGLFSDIVVYTRSVLVEQTTPVGVEISDTSSDVQNVTFTDLDLDLGDVGGHVHWETPLESSQVAAYRVYLAFDETGSSRSQIGAEVFVNSSLRVALLEPDHTTGSYKQITVYSKSDLAEQTTPVAFQLQDTESVVTDTNFTDLDLDGAELGGTIFWSPAGDTHLVVAYDLYLSESASGESLSRINESLPVGTHDLFVPPELPLGKSTHIVIFTRSSLVEQTTPAFINISDADWNVPEVSFFDMDLDGGDFGGQVSWLPPAEVVLVAHYSVYLAANASGDLRSQIGQDIPKGTNYVDLLPEQPQGPHSHIVVYTKSTLVEQTTPSFLELNDTASSVSGIVFVDRDLDEEELGGDITWVKPIDFSQVTLYSVYLSATFDAENRSRVAEDLPIGTNLAQLPAETPIRWFEYVNIYTKSPVIEQTTPASLLISDTNVQIADVEFLDQDLDEEDLGGNVTWTVTRDLGLIAHFTVYFTENDTWETGRSTAGQDVAPAEFAELFVPPDTKPPLATYSWVSVFPSSLIAERTTPFAAPINDTISPVLNVSFLDLDLDLSDLGGKISWEPPLEASQVTHYLVYLAANASGAGRSMVGSEVPYDSLSTLLDAETPRLDRDYVVVYTRSYLVESTTPSHFPISDAYSVVQVNFTDKDLDDSQIGGTISWTTPEPDFNPLVSFFTLHLADDAFGFNRSQIGSTMPWDLQEAALPPEVYYDTATHFVVFTGSTLVEQTTPSALAIYDTDASVSNITFQDKDLDESEMGGDIFWDAPLDADQVTYYAVFIGPDPLGQRSQVAGYGPAGLVPAGVEQEFINADTSIGTFQEVVVYTRSSLVEQSTAVALPIVDEFATVGSIHFMDIDQDIDMLGGEFSWVPPNDTSEVAFYVGYFATTPGMLDSGSRRFEFEILGHLNSYDLPFQTPQSGYSYFSIYTKSSLAEQTTPNSVEVIDFCQNVPTLENQSLYVEEGVHLLDIYDVPEVVITKFTGVSEDGLSLEFAPLRRGPVYMIITDTVAVAGMTNTDVQSL
ncbi:PIF1, partial [Symbiodinium necroappetens]